MNKISYNKKIFYPITFMLLYQRSLQIHSDLRCQTKKKYDDTKFNEEDYDDGKIPRHIFEFVSYDHLEARIGKDLYTG